MAITILDIGRSILSLFCKCPGYLCICPKNPRAYNGPAAGECDAGVAQLVVEGTEFYAGDVITAHINLMDSFYASSANVFCSGADKDLVYVDGVLTAGTNGSGSEACGRHASAGCSVTVYGLGVHVVEFTLKSTFQDVFWTGDTTGTVSPVNATGPMVRIAGYGSWSLFRGFVVEPS